MTRGNTTDETATTTTTDRPLRRDAEQNLTRIVEAAHNAFAELGYEASMEQIAARAEVGVGTLYRRFPNKADLFAAVVDAATTRTRRIANEVLAEVDPADAIFEFVRRCVAAPSCWRATTSPHPWSAGRADGALASLLPLIGSILRASQDARTARDDIGATDVVTVLMAVRAVADVCDPDVPGASQRFLDLALDGMRPSETSLAQQPMTPKQLKRVLCLDPLRSDDAKGCRPAWATARRAVSPVHFLHGTTTGASFSLQLRPRDSDTSPEARNARRLGDDDRSLWFPRTR